MNVAILFGRKNSKSIKNKNILKIFSKPMFMYPLDAAKKVNEIEKIYVSSDSSYILKQAKKKKCIPIKRPKSVRKLEFPLTLMPAIRLNEVACSVDST